jgi:hypothetical protein
MGLLKNKRKKIQKNKTKKTRPCWSADFQIKSADFQGHKCHVFCHVLKFFALSIDAQWQKHGAPIKLEEVIVVLRQCFHFVERFLTLSVRDWIRCLDQSR